MKEKLKQGQPVNVSGYGKAIVLSHWPERDWIMIEIADPPDWLHCHRVHLIGTGGITADKTRTMAIMRPFKCNNGGCYYHSDGTKEHSKTSFVDKCPHCGHESIEI